MKIQLVQILHKLQITASVPRFYLKITDIYATAVDYDKDSNITRISWMLFCDLMMLRF
jgi:hypothetical protein